MDKQFCKNCANFHQHYALNQRKIFRVYCGHCMQGIRRKRQPDSIACEYFELAVPDENAFATKEYLSKELLQYLLHLEILPTIENEPESYPK